MARTQITGEQILDNSITSADVTDDLELNSLYVSGSLTVAGETSINADVFEMTGTISLNGELDLSGPMTVNLKWVTGSYTITQADNFVMLNVESSGSSLSLGTGKVGQLLTLKDVYGVSSDFPIRLTGSVDGGTEAWLSSSFATLTLCWTGDRWSTI